MIAELIRNLFVPLEDFGTHPVLIRAGVERLLQLQQ